MLVSKSSCSAVPSPPTFPEWAKIRPELITWAQGVHSDLVRSNRVSTFLSASQSIQLELGNDTSLKVQPRGIDIAMLPAVRSMFESHINSEMSYDNLKKKLFRVLLRAAGKWSSDAVEELEQFAREQLGLSPLSKPSRLPSVIFQCRSCFRGGRRRERLMFDEALSHRHLYKEQRNEEQREDTREMSSYDRFVMMYGTHPRDIQVLRVDVPVSRRVENLIRRMGQNPNRVTYDELRRSTVNVVCGLCRSQAATTRMDFEHAVGRPCSILPCIVDVRLLTSSNTVSALISGIKKQKCGPACLRGIQSRMVQFPTHA